MCRSHQWRPWTVVLVRSVLIGALTGLLGGALIFFLFGFIGFSGASLATRLENGWDAAVDPGLRKGLAAGLAIAIGLTAAYLVWSLLGRRPDRSRTRMWLSLLAVASVIGSNLQSLRNVFGWDAVGIATVVGMALPVGLIVWAVTPWVLEGGSAMQQTIGGRRGLRNG